MTEQRLIDAKALWKNVEKLPSVLDANNGWLVKKTSVLAKIEDATIVEPKPVVHAYWTNGDPLCPVCKKNKFEGLDADIWADWKPLYCPNCGAKMDKGIENG